VSRIKIFRKINFTLKSVCRFSRRRRKIAAAIIWALFLISGIGVGTVLDNLHTEGRTNENSVSKPEMPDQNQKLQDFRVNFIDGEHKKPENYDSVKLAEELTEYFGSILKESVDSAKEKSEDFPSKRASREILNKFFGIFSNADSKKEPEKSLKKEKIELENSEKFEMAKTENICDQETENPMNLIKEKESEFILKEIGNEVLESYPELNSVDFLTAPEESQLGLQFFDDPEKNSEKIMELIPEKEIEAKIFAEIKKEEEVKKEEIISETKEEKLQNENLIQDQEINFTETEFFSDKISEEKKEEENFGDFQNFKNDKIEEVLTLEEREKNSIIPEKFEEFEELQDIISKEEKESNIIPEEFEKSQDIISEKTEKFSEISTKTQVKTEQKSKSKKFEFKKPEKMNRIQRFLEWMKNNS
jgi:hypothetical protein